MNRSASLSVFPCQSRSGSGFTLGRADREGELATYDKYWDGVSVERTRLADALAEGEAKGRAEGLAEGELLGQQKVALKMLRKGLGVEEVSAITEIDEEDVLRLSRLLQEFGTAAEEHCAR